MTRASQWRGGSADLPEVKRGQGHAHPLRALGGVKNKGTTLHLNAYIEQINISNTQTLMTNYALHETVTRVIKHINSWCTTGRMSVNEKQI